MNRQARRDHPTVALHLSEREEAALLWRLERAGRRIDEDREAALSAHGLSTAKLGVLKHLIQAGEPLPLGHLAARLTCVKSNITQLVDRLERDGLVQRVPDSDDRRCLRAMITEEGRRRYALGTKAEVQVEHILLSSFSRREQKELAALLAKFELDGS
jgi:DNA-binding MarR family transcriptional regulator